MARDRLPNNWPSGPSRPFGVLGVIEFLRAPALTRHRREAEFRRCRRTDTLSGARNLFLCAGRFALGVRRRFPSSDIAIDDLGGSQIDRRAASRFVPSRSAVVLQATGRPAVSPLKVLLTGLALLNVRQHPGVVVGIELPVQKLQQDAVVGTCIHDGVPRVAAPVRPGVASMVFTQDTVFANEHYMILFRFGFFPACNAIGEIKPMWVSDSGRVRGARSARRWERLPTRRKASWPTSIFAFSSSARVSDPAEPTQVSIPSPLPGYGSRATVGLQMLGSTVNPREQRFFGNGDLRSRRRAGSGDPRPTVGRWTRTTVSMFKTDLQRTKDEGPKTNIVRRGSPTPPKRLTEGLPIADSPCVRRSLLYCIWPASQTPPTGMTVDRPTPTNFLDAPRTTYFVRIITRIKPISPQSSGCHGTIPDR